MNGYTTTPKNMICIDSNILIYAFNTENEEFHLRSQKLLKEIMYPGKLAICDTSLIEFFQVLTDKRRLNEPYNVKKAQSAIDFFLNIERCKVLYTNKEIYDEAFKALNKYSIKKYDIYDHIIAFTCRYNNIKELYTVNVKDFKKYDFLNVVNPFFNLFHF